MNLFISMLMVLFISNPFNTSDITPENTTQKTEVVIEGNDQMRFDLSEIKVQAGETVSLTLKHTGKLPKERMGHNWVLLAAGTNVQTFAVEAMKARDNEYIPKDSKQILAYTSLIGGGEEVTIEFTAPEAGEYDFICTFPGHYALMKGKLIVE